MRFALTCKACGQFFGWHPSEPPPECPRCGCTEFHDEGTV